MRTLFPLAAVLCLGIMAAFFAGSGFNAIVSGDAQTGQVQDSVVGAGNDTAVDSGKFNSSNAGGSESSIIGTVFAAAGQLFSFLQLVLLLPGTLRELGFPQWFALPVGSLVSIIVSVGFFQFVTQRDWR